MVISWLELPDIIPSPTWSGPSLSLTLLSQFCLILILSVCGHVPEWSPGWSVSRVPKGLDCSKMQILPWAPCPQPLIGLRQTLSLISCSQIDSLPFPLGCFGVFQFGGSARDLVVFWHRCWNYANVWLLLIRSPLLAIRGDTSSPSFAKCGP